MVRRVFEIVNSYLSTFRHTLDQVGLHITSLTVKLQHLPSGGKLAAIINIQNLSTVDTRKIIFFRRYGNQS
jgi:hypothetical protein